MRLQETNTAQSQGFPNSRHGKTRAWTVTDKRDPRTDSVIQFGREARNAAMMGQNKHRRAQIYSGCNHITDSRTLNIAGNDRQGHIVPDQTQNKRFIVIALESRWRVQHVNAQPLCEPDAVPSCERILGIGLLG